MWRSPAIAGIVGARSGPLFEPRRGLHFIPRVSGFDCCEVFTAGRVSSTPRPFFGRWTPVWQAGVRLRQIVDHRLFAKVANGRSHGLTIPSASLMRLRSYYWVQIIKLTDHLSNYSQGIWLLFYAFGEQTERHSQESRGCILCMLVAQREHHRQESVPT